MVKPHSKDALEAAICLYALGVLNRLGFDAGITKREVVRKLGVGHTTAYDLLPTVEAALDRGLNEVPADSAVKTAEQRKLEIRNAVLEYRVAHPGAWVCGGRTVYSADLVTFVLALASESVGPSMTQAEFADACGIPLPTLKDWWAHAKCQQEFAFAPSMQPAAPLEPVTDSVDTQRAIASRAPTEAAEPETAATEPIATDGATVTSIEPSATTELTAAAAAMVNATDSEATSEPNAETAEPNAETAEPNAETAEPNAETAEPNAETAEPNAEAAEPNAETSEPNDETSEPNAETAEPTAATPEASTASSLGFSQEMLRIVSEYESWHGTVPAFVDHIRSLGLRYNRELITQILHLAAARKLLRRTPPKPPARGSTYRPPPGLQWTSDGKQIDVIVDGKPFRVTWQPTVDVGSTATVGSVVRPEEDTDGVRTSFAEGVETTGAKPAAMLLDNKACNKSEALKEELAPETFVMHSAPARPESKAVIEGGFGLFAQALGPIVADIDSSSGEQIALDVGGAVTRAYALGRNHHPRKKSGRTPYELYRDADPSPEEISDAVEQLRAIKDRVDAQQARKQARLDPAVTAIIERACQRFGFFDDGDIALSLRTLPLAPIQSAISIYAAKLQADSLPHDAGIRYFAGIAWNCQHQRELQLFEQELVAQLEQTDKLVFDFLEHKAASFESLELAPHLLAIVNELITVTAPVSQVFWRRRIRRVAETVPLHLRPELRQSLCRRIRGHFKATKQHRQQLVDLVVRLFVAETQAA